jgi:hypothetical protein
MPQPLKSVDGKQAGFITGTTFYKLCKCVHILHTPYGWAVDAAMFDTFEDLGIDTIIIFNTETGLQYTARYLTFKNEKRTVERSGFGKQYALTMPFWVKEPTNVVLFNQLTASVKKRKK